MGTDKYTREKQQRYVELVDMDLNQKKRDRRRRNPFSQAMLGKKGKKGIRI